MTASESGAEDNEEKRMMVPVGLSLLLLLLAAQLASAQTHNHPPSPGLPIAFLSRASHSRPSLISASSGYHQADDVRPTCPQGFEAHIDAVSGQIECQCKKYHLFWPEDGSCYREYQQGPCPDGHRLVFDETIRKAVCICPFFWTKHTDGKCYQEYTQGPCPDGELIMFDKEAGRGRCGCDPDLEMNYYRPTGQCYELYKKGPCPEGHILSFDYASLTPECKCKDHYHLHSDGKCYALNTPGPCPHEMRSCRGTPCFMKSLEALDIQCTCLPKHSTTSDGHCYQPYTRGPCQFGEWLVFKKDGTSVCESKKYCKRFDNWHWWSPHQRCYRQFSQGPCKKGKLFYLDTDHSGTGCYCKPEWQAYYWNQTGECFEQESSGPCATGQYFAYNATSGRTECNCFTNFVFNDALDTCVEMYTQGPCPEGQLVTMTPEGRFQCSCGDHLKSHFWPKTGKCYAHYEQGPCKPGEQFRAHPTDQRPVCIVWGHTSISNSY